MSYREFGIWGLGFEVPLGPSLYDDSMTVCSQ